MAAKPYDPTLKKLVEIEPESWPVLLGYAKALPNIIKRIGQRLSGRSCRKLAPQVWGAAYILLGLRYSPALAAQLIRGEYLRTWR